jgi:hypothetical protein
VGWRGQGCWLCQALTGLVCDRTGLSCRHSGMQIQFNVVSVGCVTDTVRLTDMGWGGRKVVDGCISREGLIILAGGGGGGWHA